ncbi:hypothetical protein [Paenibacillus mendelii]|uniref:Uncharacterized protein n=1 Tax=Paenibacillus mendelii TaxID=206163 RepID=A0ABV6JAU0_9BACL|nr:hypothetical protein [Paenibacillus mendelii]MCQ6562893.1 hypothetical protein [Paenibacillus mendelii]
MILKRWFTCHHANIPLLVEPYAAKENSILLVFVVEMDFSSKYYELKENNFLFLWIGGTAAAIISGYSYSILGV